MLPKVKRLWHTVRHHKVRETSRLPIALGLAVCFALIVTVTGVIIYNLNGSSKLDLSRPGFEREREEVRADESPKVYDTTSPVTRAAIKDFLDEYDGRNKDLAQYGDFRDQVLSDADLQLEGN